MEQLANYYQVWNFVQSFILVENGQNLQSSFIGIIGSLIAILFSILITIVVSSSNKYPSNFIKRMSEDKITRRFYMFLVSAIVFQIFLYFLGWSYLFLDVAYIIIIFVGLFKYWKYILGFLDPIKLIDDMSDEGLLKEEITELGDYVKIGLENKNQELVNMAMEKLSGLNKRLKDG